MLDSIKKIIRSIKAYRRYFREAMIETYLYYTSLWPLLYASKKNLAR